MTNFINLSVDIIASKSFQIVVLYLKGQLHVTLYVQSALELFVTASVEYSAFLIGRL
jgi:hypothetical protein